MTNICNSPDGGEFYNVSHYILFCDRLTKRSELPAHTASRVRRVPWTVCPKSRRQHRALPRAEVARMRLLGTRYARIGLDPR